MASLWWEKHPELLGKVIKIRLSATTDLEWRGVKEGSRYCIVDSGEVLNRSFEWEPELSPSNRTQAFKDRTRFETIDETYEHWLKFLSQEAKR